MNILKNIILLAIIYSFSDGAVAVIQHPVGQTLEYSIECSTTLVITGLEKGLYNCSIEQVGGDSGIPITHMQPSDTNIEWDPKGPLPIWGPFKWQINARKITAKTATFTVMLYFIPVEVPMYGSERTEAWSYISVQCTKVG